MIVKHSDHLHNTKTLNRREADLIIDTSKMNKRQAESLVVAEQARDADSSHTGFASQLLLGRCHPADLLPFPKQTPADRAIGDDMVERVCAFLSENLDPEKIDETKTIPDRIVKGLMELGVFRMKVPIEYGGLGFSQVNYNRVMMAIASHCGSTAVLVSAHQSIGVPQPLKMFGTPEQKERYLRMIADGAISAFALTEPNVGSDPARMETTARKSADGSHYILTGIKQWTTNGPIADLLVVMAKTISAEENGSSRPRITAFIVETKWKGVHTDHRCDFMGLRGIQNGIMRFDRVKVPAENVLWGEGLGLKLALKTLNTGRLTLPAACAGMGKQCLSIARRWGKDREQWGRAIGEHEAGSEKITDIASSTLAMEAITWLTSHWADEHRDIRIEAAMAKLFCSETAWRVIDETMQLRGGRGYETATSLRERGEDPYPVERMMREARINLIIEGTSEIMRLYLAREALDPHLRKAVDFLKPGTPIPSKLRCALGMLGFYSHWYPTRTIGMFPIHRGAPYVQLAPQMRYVRRASNRLARSLFHAMVRHGPKLERRQLLLGAQMDIATELFAMSATCAYATSLEREGSIGAIDLADQFCQRARIRIGQHFASLHMSPRQRPGQFASRVLADEMQWLETGIIPAAAAQNTTKAPTPQSRKRSGGTAAGKGS